jgi:hypothetical protein
MRRRRIFKWAQRSAREKVLFSLLADKLDDSVLAEVRRRSPRFLRDDQFAWLNESVVSVRGGRLEPIPSVLAGRLLQFCDGVVEFHGCRPLSLNSYQMEGLKPSDTDSLRQQARQLFEDTREMAAAIAELGGAYESHNRGKIWLCITKESFLRRHHEGFLLHGSEYLAGLANRLRHGETIGKLGVPTIVECVVPKSDVPVDFWIGLSQNLIEDWFSRFLGPQERSPVCTLCLEVSKRIPPELIIKYHQFKECRHQFSWDNETGEQMSGEYITFSPLSCVAAKGAGKRP